MEPPSRSDDTTRAVENQKSEAVPLPTTARHPDYSELREAQSQRPEAAPEATAPTRPEAERSPGWTQYGGMREQQLSALEYAKAAQQHLAERLSTPKAENQEQARGENEQQKTVEQEREH